MFADFCSIAILDDLSNILHKRPSDVRNRTPDASSRETRPTHWLGYTKEVRLRGLTRNQGFQPAQAGFACVAATSSRLV